MLYSPQQLSVFAAVEDVRGGNLIVEAVAGSGKTTTLVEAVRRMKGSVAFAAYNKKIATEIQARVAGLSNVKAGTFHSFGLNAWTRVAGRGVRVEGKKLLILQDRLGADEQTAEFSRKLVSLAKQSGIGFLSSLDDWSAWDAIVQHHELDDSIEGSDLQRDDLIADGIKAAQKLMRLSIETDRELIDFDDMIFAPLYHDAKVWQNDWVLIDEAQDTNPARRALAKKMLRPGGRLVAVGDPRQAIYGFTGADNDALDIIVREFSATRLPLTITYRCPKAVVAHAQQWVSHISAADTAPAGSVETVSEDAFWDFHASALSAEDAVLCRNTKPLVSLAFALIRKGIGCHVEGRDIGAGIMALARRWKTGTLSVLRTRLEQYLERETQRFLAKGQEQKAASLEDRVETLLVIMDATEARVNGATVADLQTEVNRLFGDVEPGRVSNNVTLSTVHKSKGREWDRVYLLGRNLYMPSKYARQSWQQDQEANLIYVAVTRAKQSLIEIAVAPQTSRRKTSVPAKESR